MELISPTDSMFLLAESREHPMHVGGLQLFEPPDDMGPEFLAQIYNDLLTYQDVQPTFRKHPGRLFGGIATWRGLSIATSTSSTTYAAQRCPSRGGSGNCLS